MADAANPENPAAAGQAPPQMRIVRQFLRDLSFENVGWNTSLEAARQPEINVNVALDAEQAGTDRHMVALKVTATATAQDATVFLAEVDYAGVFEMHNIPEGQLHVFLMVECPRFLFPFVRRIISDVTRDGGYPPLMLDTIDFMALFRAEIQRRQAEAAQQGGGGTVN